MSFLAIVLCITLYFLFYLHGVRNTLAKDFHRVDQAYLGLLRMQEKRTAIVHQFSQMWKSEGKGENKLLLDMELIIKQLKTPSITKQEQQALYSSIDGLLFSAKQKLLGPNPSLTETQMQFMLSSINEVEEQLSAARRSYYAAVAKYNTSLDSFFTSIMANQMGYLAVDPYESTLPDTLELKDIEPIKRTVELDRNEDDYYA